MVDTGVVHDENRVGKGVGLHLSQQCTHETAELFRVPSARQDVEVQHALQRYSRQNGVSVRVDVSTGENLTSLARAPCAAYEVVVPPSAIAPRCPSALPPPRVPVASGLVDEYKGFRRVMSDLVHVVCSFVRVALGCLPGKLHVGC